MRSPGPRLRLRKTGLPAAEVITFSEVVACVLPQFATMALISGFAAICSSGFRHLGKSRYDRGVDLGPVNAGKRHKLTQNLLPSLGRKIVRKNVFVDVAHAGQSIHEAVTRSSTFVVVSQNVRHGIGGSRSYLPPDGATLRIIKKLAVIVSPEVQSIPVRAAEGDVDLAAIQLDGSG